MKLDTRSETSATSLPETDSLRAQAIRCSDLRAEFIAARKFLRGLLAARLAIPEMAIEILQEPNEKPHLAGGGIEFSLSHRDGWCAVALARGCPVGVDVEPLQPFAGIDEVVAQFFPPVARAAFAAAIPEERVHVFFRWWTRIEAAVKALGKGLDSAAFCLGATVQLSCEPVSGLALAIAAQSCRPLAVDWKICASESHQVTISPAFMAPATG